MYQPKREAGMFWNSQTNADKEGKFSVKKLVLFEGFEKSMLEF